MRSLIMSICACVALAPAGAKPSAVQGDAKPGPSQPAATKEIPAGWRRGDIADAAPPRSDGGPAHVLAWKSLEDDRPWRVDYCLVLKELKKPNKDGARWVLASLARNPKPKESGWEIVTIWPSPDPELKAPPFIMHLEEFKERPRNADIYRFMDEHEWHLGAGADWKLIDGGVCKAWGEVIGEEPTRRFK